MYHDFFNFFDATVHDSRARRSYGQSYSGLWEVKPRETGGIPVEYVNRRREECKTLVNSMRSTSLNRLDESLTVSTCLTPEFEFRFSQRSRRRSIARALLFPPCNLQRVNRQWADFLVRTSVPAVPDGIFLVCSNSMNLWYKLGTKLFAHTSGTSLVRAGVG